jgi:hypothetical protein
MRFNTKKYLFICDYAKIRINHNIKRYFKPEGDQLTVF